MTSRLILLLLLPLAVGGERISADQLQKMADNVMAQTEGKVWSEVTPEVQKTIDSLVTLIGSTIKPAIKADFITARDELTALKNKLKEETEEAVTRKLEADHEDHERWECYGKERESKKILEKCDEDLEGLLTIKWTKCNFTDTMTWELTSGQYLNKTCSVKDAARNPPNADDCEPLKGLLDEEKTISKKLCKGLTSFRKSVKACEKATRDWEKKYIECEKAYEIFEDQAEQCLKQEEWTRVRLCTSFGIEYQEKCLAYDNFMALKAQIQNKTTGAHVANTYSEPDRIAEYTAVAKVECMLRSYQEQPTPGFDEASWKKCEDDDKYPHVMNYWEIVVRGLMTVENFNCKEHHIKFYSKYIDRKRSSKAGEERFLKFDALYVDYEWGTASDGWLKKEFKVDKNEENSPFGFCTTSLFGGTNFTGSTGEDFVDKVVVNENVQFKIGTCDFSNVDETNTKKFNSTGCSGTKCVDWKASVRQLECDYRQELPSKLIGAIAKFNMNGITGSIKLSQQSGSRTVSIGSDPHGGANKKCVKQNKANLHCLKEAGDPGKRVNKDFWNAPDRFDITVEGFEVCAMRLDHKTNLGWGMNLQIRCAEPVHVSVDLKGDGAKLAGKYHVHVNKVSGKCDTTGGHWNPNGATGKCDPAKIATCEAGDLSGKYGAIKFFGDDGYHKTYVDSQLSLAGATSVAGRSITIHHKDTGARIACATLQENECDRQVSFKLRGQTGEELGTIEYPVGKFYSTNFKFSTAGNVFKFKYIPGAQLKVVFKNDKVVGKKDRNIHFEPMENGESILEYHMTLGQPAAGGKWGASWNCVGTEDFPGTGDKTGENPRCGWVRKGIMAWNGDYRVNVFGGDSVEVDAQADTRRTCVHSPRAWTDPVTVKCREYWQPDAHDVDGWMNTTRGEEPSTPDVAAPNTY